MKPKRLVLAWAMTLFVSLTAFAAPPAPIIVATVPTGGLPPFAEALATQITNALAVSASVEAVSGGGPDVVRRVASSSTRIGIAGAVVREALLGEGAFSGNPVQIRTLTPLFSNVIHLVSVEGIGIGTLSDLRGKRVSLGAPGTPDERDAVRILRAAGIDSDRDIQRMRVSSADAVVGLRERRIDAAFMLGFPPHPLVVDLASTPGLRIQLVDLNAVLAVLRREFGNIYVHFPLQKELYEGLTSNVATIGLPLTLFVRQDFDSQLAYRITRLVYERRIELSAHHRAVPQISLLGVGERSSLPFHSGAIRYFQERGVSGF